jgi:hypothetical protein
MANLPSPGEYAVYAEDADYNDSPCILAPGGCNFGLEKYIKK